jgi:uncharacterized damage-inducible protein DinB
MNDDFVSLIAYNRWADRHILDACRRLTPEQYAAEPVPGWSSVRSTVVHIATVFEGWLRGVGGEHVQSVPTEEELATVDDAERHLDRGYAILEGLLPTLTPEKLATPQTLSGRGRTVSLPPWAILRHLVNHSTYHRGQLASKLKRFGVEAPATDFIFWVMEQQAARPA